MQLGPRIPISLVPFCCREGGSCRPCRERSSCNLTSSCQILTEARNKHFRVSDMVYPHVFGRQRLSVTSYSGPKQPTWPVGPWNIDWALRMQGYLGCAISQDFLIVFLLLKDIYAVEIAAVLLARLFLLLVLREPWWPYWQVHGSQWGFVLSVSIQRPLPAKSRRQGLTQGTAVPYDWLRGKGGIPPRS